MTIFRRLNFTLLTLLASLVATNDVAYSARQHSDAASLHVLFGPNVFASNINATRHHASALSLEERYNFLKHWVLPTSTHPDIRVIGEFNPTNPSHRAIQLEPERYPSSQGGDLVSPVFDLIDTASELKRLEGLYAEVAAVDAVRDEDARAKLVLLILIRLAQEQWEDADALMTQLHQRFIDSLKKPYSNYHAELLLLYDAVARKRELELAGDLLVVFHNNRHAFDITNEWKSHLCTLVGDYPLHLNGDSNMQEASDSPFLHWSPAARSIAMTRGNGYPTTIWRRSSNGELTLRSGHHRDYLFFASPLAGNYEVAGDIDLGGQTQIMTGGLFVGPRGRSSIEIGKFRSKNLVKPVDPPFAARDPWVRYRSTINNDKLEVFLNERLFVERELGSNFDPWIATRGIADATGRLRHLQIAGEPQVLDEVDLSAQAAFSNWYTYYFFTEDAGNAHSLWRWEADEARSGQIVAKRHPSSRGSWMESILRYHHPLGDEAEIEYEFFYSPTEIHIHPALDRLAFLLEPRGVGLHWCTDGKYDRTPITPDHEVFEPNSQRGARPLPLNAGAWNHIKMALVGQSVTLTLNGRLVFEYDLPEANLRTFGLFRYADQTGSRIRGVKLKGNWPKSVSAITEQEFADPRLVTIEKEIGDLPHEFHHNFVRDGLPNELFKLTGQQLDTGITEESDGVHVKLNGVSGWTVAAIMPKLNISGDFDIRADFELQDLDAGWQDGLAFLEVRVADEQKHYVRAMRGHDTNTGHSVRFQVMRGPDERRQLDQNQYASWTPAGCFRIVRIGDQITSLFAPKGSAVFRVLGQEKIGTDAPVEDVLLELALRDASQGHVVWKNLSVRAEQLK